MLNLITYPNRILRQRSRKVKLPEIASAQFKAFLSDLGKTMLKEDGLGLAANQVNCDLRVFSVNFKGRPKVFINSFVYFRSFGKETGEEGCLSLPGVFGTVKRSRKIRLFYRDEQGRLRHLTAKGLLARVILHETDHINGVLIIDRISKYQLGRKKVELWKKQARANEI